MMYTQYRINYQIVCIVGLIGSIFGSYADDTIITITDSMVITQSGNYELANDIIGTITIASDYVYLNLNGKRIFDCSQGIRIVQQAHCSIENGVIENTQEGIFIDTCTHIDIKWITSCSNQKGIVAQTTENLALDMNIIQNNIENGIEINACSGAQVTNNQFDGNDTSIMMQQSDAVYVAYNTSNSSVQDGLSATGCNNAFIINNIGKNGYRGIYLQNSSNCNVSRNYCADCDFGIYLDAGTNNDELNFNQSYCTVDGYDLGSGNRFVYNQV